MFKLHIKNKFGRDFERIGTIEEINSFQEEGISKNYWGKQARQVLKDSNEYDISDVISEEEKEIEPSCERIIYSETETINQEFTDIDGIIQTRIIPKPIGSEIIPAKIATFVNLKSEYELSEIIDLSIDPDYIKQKDEEESSYNIANGKLIISKIGGLNLRKQREGTFNVEMSNYLQAFTVPFSLLSSGAIDTSLIVVSTLNIHDPYSEEEMNEIKKFHHDAINGRPKR